MKNQSKFTKDLKKGQFSKEIVLKKDDIRFEDYRNFVKPKIQGFEVTDPPGFPALPVKNHILILPPGSQDFKITLTKSEKEAQTHYTKKFPYPIQESIPDVGIDPKHAGGLFSSKITIKFTLPNFKAYLYQKKSVKIESVEEMELYTVVKISLRPISYDLTSKCFRINEELDYQIDYNYPEPIDKEGIIKKLSRYEKVYFENYAKLEDVFFSDDFILQAETVEGNYPHIIITDNYRWSESFDRGDGTTRPPELAERGIAIGSDLIIEFESLAKWKTCCGMRSRVFTISDIVDKKYGDFTNQGFARDLQEVIRNFLKHAQTEWGTNFVLIGGDVHIVPIRNLVGSSLYRTLGCRTSNDNPPPIETFHFIANSSVVKLRPLFNPLSTDPLSTYHGGILIPFNLNANQNNPGWYFTNRNDFDTQNNNFTRLPAGTNYIIVEGPNNIINDSYYWVRDLNLIPSDMYYASLTGSGYSRSGLHDYDSNNNNIYGQYHVENNQKTSLDDVDFNYDLWVGRASVDNQDQAAAFVNKVISYEKLKTSAGIDIDTSYLQQIMYAASYFEIHSQSSQYDNTRPPDEGRFTHVNGTTETKITTDFDIELYRIFPSFNLVFTNYRLVAIKNHQRIVIPYKENASATNLGWFFTRPYGELFSDMTVNSDYHGQQYKPRIAMDQNGNFAIVWEDDKNENNVYQILARGFNADGTQKFADFTVNSVATGQQYKPDIAMAPNGDFI
ncbi:MAG: C25 family cysteine peptidase, partial [Promethearchaeota archaeon]